MNPCIWRVASEAQVLGLRLEIVSYDAVINACMMSGKMGKAVEWPSKALEAGLTPEKITHYAVIDACANLRDMDKTCGHQERRGPG